MNENSNVTVVIPCFNDGKYVTEALQSIYNQTSLPEKIIVIDDGSDVETKKVLAKINHPLVQIIFQENQGVSMARNNAIAHSQTDFIVNLDADDYYEPTFIEKGVAILNQFDSIGAVGCFYKILKNNVIQKEVVKPLGGTIANFLIKNNALGTCMFRKKCWEQTGGYDSTMIDGYEDWEFWISVLKNDWQMYILEEPLFVYRIKRESRDKTALSLHDYELRKYIYNKHKDVFLQDADFYILELLRQNALFRNTINKIKMDYDYKIGSTLLKPVRFFKNLLKK